ncbi:tetratricopeptide repeat protein [Thermopetrobacter sp. TC1]|uniref:tetratricopeptide repeat protein n=1 Tax=Thermopetrobacter sp. TC1 TaxID=1495045 RepID=UPI00068E16E6|nr:tetratricopeptide repeat protein [Thermopetrobacter sp. TC1]
MSEKPHFPKTSDTNRTRKRSFSGLSPALLTIGLLALFIAPATHAAPDKKADQPSATQTTEKTAPQPSAEKQLEKALALLDEGKVQKAVPLLLRAARTNGDAAFYLGRLLELGLLQDAAGMQTAVAFYRKGVERGSALAMDRLGLLYLTGNGVIRDYAEGAKLVCKAAESGAANALFDCGIVLLEGRGIKQDKKKALDYLQKAYAKGHLGAGNLLAELYLGGQAGKTDKKKAFELTRKVAERGNPAALFRLGQMYAAGIGTKKNLIKAYMYLNLAAARQQRTAAQALQTLERRMRKQDVLKAQALSRNWKPKKAENQPLSKRLTIF